ncbi:TPA: hypothetical protein NBN12_003295 [Klebsiella pneumoniae]|nr:hypothetical protein [Klebsiella pneumoniae]
MAIGHFLKLFSRAFWQCLRRRDNVSPPAVVLKDNCRTPRATAGFSVNRLKQFPEEFKLAVIQILLNRIDRDTAENTDLYDYNRQVNRGWRDFILRLMGIHLPDNGRVHLQGINARKESIYPA